MIDRSPSSGRITARSTRVPSNWDSSAHEKESPGGEAQGFQGET